MNVKPVIMSALTARRFSLCGGSFLCYALIIRTTHLTQVMGPSSRAAADPMDEDEGEGDMVESAVNRQTALLSLDVLARVLGRRHQGAFVGVLDDVTEIVAGEGTGALPGEI